MKIGGGLALISHKTLNQRKSSGNIRGYENLAMDTGERVGQKQENR
jgi:hypothetical protein